MKNNNVGEIFRRAVCQNLPTGYLRPRFFLWKIPIDQEIYSAQINVRSVGVFNFEVYPQGLIARNLPAGLLLTASVVSENFGLATSLEDFRQRLGKFECLGWEVFSAGIKILRTTPRLEANPAVIYGVKFCNLSKQVWIMLEESRVRLAFDEPQNRQELAPIIGAIERALGLKWRNEVYRGLECADIQ